MPCTSASDSFRPFWILGLLALSVAATGCGRRASGPEESEATPVSVRQAPVQTRIFERTVKAQGTWAAETFALVPSRLGGTLLDLKVEDGARVEQGQALAVIDPEPWAHAVESRTQDVSVARSDSLFLSVQHSDLVHCRLDHAVDDRNRLVFYTGLGHQFECRFVDGDRDVGRCSGHQFHCGA